MSSYSTHLHVARLEPRTVLRIFRILLRWAWSLALVVRRVGLASRGLEVFYLQFDTIASTLFIFINSLTCLPSPWRPFLVLLFFLLCLWSSSFRACLLWSSCCEDDISESEKCSDELGWATLYVKHSMIHFQYSLKISTQWANSGKIMSSL